MPSEYLPYNAVRVPRNITRLVIFSSDMVFTMVSWVGASYLLYGFEQAPVMQLLYSWPTLVLIALRFLSFLWFRSWNIILRYVGEKDYFHAFLTVWSPSAVFSMIYLVGFVPAYGLRVLAIVWVDFFIMLSLMVGFRMALRMVYDWLKVRQNHRKATAIFGAGEMGSMLERVIRYNASNEFRVDAFFDDNPKVHGKRLNGIPVFNPQKSFSKMVAKYGIEVIILGIRDLPPARKASFINQCLAHQIQVLKLPPVESWLHGELNLRLLKNINLEDLLGRAPILLDEVALRASIQGKTVLVTGCAGSIGSEILRQLLRQEPAFVLGVDQAESPLAEIALELKTVVEEGRFLPVIGDVRDSDRMARLFEEYRPEYVFHAAAYKHVPIMEDFPEEAIKSNVLGTRVLADLAVQHQAEKFVMISTDKAVNPSNVMGASKRIAEIYVQALNYSEGCTTQFITTRFGNVLGSNGSVIPIFKEQIEKGLPLTVTHPDIKRFFMTIPEACSLVLEAGAMGHGGEIFVFDMGEQVRILDLAHRMIQIYGLTPGKDVEIQFIGLRPGEKLYEELLDHKETLAETHHPKIFRAQVRPGDFHQIRSDIDLLIAGAQNGWRPAELVQTMKTLVPEFVSQNSVFSELDNKEPQT
ncbi:MAG: hypothetical protein KIPDCIKN_02274 [Haliscomenobacter sp.]|nr:hypothetical protein [Haliscomenobacter sp.]